MQVEVITDEAGFRSLEQPWNDCLATMGGGNPFLSHQWLWAWWCAYGKGRQLMVLVLREGETIHAAAPLFKTTQPYYGVPVQQILFIGTHTFDRLNFLHRDLAAEPLRELCRYLMNQCRGRTLVRLEELPETAALFESARDLPGCWAEEASSTLPYIPRNRTWEEYRKTLTHKFRSEMRTRVKVFASLGQWQLECIRGGEVKGQLDNLVAVEVASNKLAAGAAFLADDMNLDFLQRLLASTGPAEPVLLKLVIEDQLIAYLLGFIHGEVFCAYNTAYLPGFEKGSPGKWIMDQGVKFAFDEGLAEFDFLRGQFGYKERWQPEIRCSRRLLLFPDNPLGWILRTIVFQLRPRLKRALK